MALIMYTGFVRDHAQLQLRTASAEYDSYGPQGLLRPHDLGYKGVGERAVSRGWTGRKWVVHLLLVLTLFYQNED